MTTRDKLEYQKRLRFLREEKAKTASEKLKLATKAEESDLTKRMVTLGDKENRVPVRGETPKAYNEVPETRETSRVKDPLKAGDEGDNVLDIDLSDLDYAKISEQKRFYVKRVGREEKNEPYSGSEMDKLGIEPQFYSDEAEAGTVADMLIDLDPHSMEDFYVANLEDEPIEIEEDDDFEELLRETTPPQEDADQSLSRMKKRKKATRTKSMKRKSHAKLNESNLSALLRECGCEMESPFDAPEDEPQGYMLVQNLEKLAKKAGELTGVAKYTDDAEPWVESKVNSAAEHIDAIYDYIKYGRNKKSDMNGQEDLHPPHHDEMMNEIKKKVSLKTILEQTDDGPTEFDYAMGMGATGFASPDASVPAAPTAAPTVSARTAARPGRRPPVTDAIQACNLIFNEQTPRSFAMHLKRLKRGLESNDATIADYELRANSTHIAFVTNRYMQVILAANSSLSSQIDTVKNAIREFNTPALPQQLSQITNRRAVISKITTLQNVLTSNASICDSLRNAPPEATTPGSTPTPSTTSTTTPEREPPLSPEEQTRLNNANRALTEAQQAISEYINSIVRGEVDLSDTRNRPAYFERLNQLVSAYNNAMREVQSLNASRGTEVLDRSVENYIRHIDNVINQLNANPNAVQMYFESRFDLGLEKSLKRLIENVPSSKEFLTDNLLLKEGFITTLVGAEIARRIGTRLAARFGPAAAARVLQLTSALRSLPSAAGNALRAIAASNSAAAEAALVAASEAPTVTSAAAALEAGTRVRVALTSAETAEAAVTAAVEAATVAETAGAPAAAAVTAAEAAATTAATAAGEGAVAGTVATLARQAAIRALAGLGIEVGAGGILGVLGSTAAGLNAPTATLGTLAAGAGLATGAALRGLGVGAASLLTGRGTHVEEIDGIPVGLVLDDERFVADPANIRFAATAATRILQNQKSALQSIRNSLRTGGSARISGITNPYSRSFSDIANEIDPARGLPRD